nr:hypothetical protein BaRGS_007203 [Batillaria attramentaria]
MSGNKKQKQEMVGMSEEMSVQPPPLHQRCSHILMMFPILSDQKPHQEKGVFVHKVKVKKVFEKDQYFALRPYFLPPTPPP